jgi:hypothetical protein
MPKSVFAIDSNEKVTKHKECRSCVSRMCGGDFYYIGMEW